MLSTGMCTNWPFRILIPYFTLPSRIFTASLVGISSSRIATRIELWTGGIIRSVSRMTLLRYGSSSRAAYISCHCSFSVTVARGGYEDENSRNSARRRSCKGWFRARSSNVQVRARDVVSDPAKKKVFTLASRSSSDIRWVEDMSCDRFDLTRKGQNMIDEVTPSSYLEGWGSQHLRNRSHSSLLLIFVLSFLEWFRLLFF